MFVNDRADILHADLDAFYASVEQRDEPRLRGRPVIVGAGVVLAASYEAKRAGVQTAMPGYRARRLCPEAVVVPPRFSVYSAASKQVFEIFRDTTPEVEGISIDEAFLAVGGLRRLVGPPEQIAVTLRRRVRAEVGLPITVGVARTKFLAKVASGVAKPDGLLVVPPDGELDFLHPLAVERLWGVGRVTAAKLHAAGIGTVGELARMGEVTLSSMLGKGSGRHLAALAEGRDPRRVQTGRRRGSIGAQSAIGRGRHNATEIDATAVALVDRVTGRMRAAGRSGRTVILRLRFDDFSRATRSHTLGRATQHTPTVLGTVRLLLETAGPLIRERGITLVGISVTNFDAGDAVQLELPFGRSGCSGRELPSSAGFALDEAVDEVKHKFGNKSLTRATLLHRRHDLEMPMLPD